MSELTASRTEHHVWCGKSDWGAGGPLTEYAPQIVTVHALSGCVSIPADEIDLLIEALATVRDAMKGGAA